MGIVSVSSGGKEIIFNLLKGYVCCLSRDLQTSASSTDTTHAGNREKKLESRPISAIS